uniref:Putative auto-transporter adhesin head GIN domain-containing protein n=1 Tax=Globisporangium ultimum (strain ATCC 200006 / CBS 805.95 / DAOM BR144) TaxID=431595 RepID=K3W9G3_GLOUD
MRSFFQPLLRSTRARRAAVLAGAAPFAYEIREKLRAPDAIVNEKVLFPIADKQRVEKRWTMASASNTSINRIRISTPGITYVSVSDSDATLEPNGTDHQVGAIRVSADKDELLDCIEVVPFASNGLEVRFKKDAPEMSGHLLTELVLAHAVQVNELEASGGGIVVVQDDVLVSDCAHAQLQIQLKGAGELFVASPCLALNVKRVVLSVSGSGKLHFDTSSVVAADDVLLQVAGTGQISTFAKRIHAPLVKSSIAGAGHVSTFSDDLSTRKLKSSVAGYGKVMHVGRGLADTQRINITGSGEVVSRQIESDNATMRVFGLGEATIDVKDALEATCKGSGVVRYVNAPPKSITTSSISLERERAAVKRANDEAALPKSTLPPRREDAFDDISVNFDPKSACGRDSFDVFSAIDAFKSAISGKRDCEIHFHTDAKDESASDTKSYRK